MTTKQMTVKDALEQAQTKFDLANKRHQAVDWQQERNFVRQALQANTELTKCDPQSLQDAIINLAAIGITLNPAQKFAYLIPRGGKCVLDISYMGLIRLATDTGSVLWAKAELVYENDNFQYRGPTEKPIHETNPFKRAKGEKLIGVYCVAKTADGTYLTETMTLEDIEIVRSRSKAKSGPWFDFFGEMCKKSVIKRASKTWPKTDRTIRLDRAISVLNEHEGITSTEHDKQVVITDDECDRLAVAINDHGLDESVVLRALGIADLSHLPAKQFDSAMKMIKESKAA